MIDITAAQLRAAAMDAEKSLNWHRAADLWLLAAGHYPRATDARPGSLAALDIAKLRTRGLACRKTAQMEAAAAA